MAVVTSFLAGILAAFTPCILVLFPALVYRFTTTSKKNLPKELFSFAVSFVGVFLVVALFLNEILSSTIKQGFQLGIGLLFIVLGLLAITNRFNPLHFPLIKNPFLFGLLFAIIASINPCSFAYLGLLASTSTGALVASFFAFALGLLVPSGLFVIFGKTLFTTIKKTQRMMKYMNQLMNVLLIFMGGYLLIKITHLGLSDIITASILLGVTFFVLLRAFYFFETKLSFPKLLLLVALFGILLVAVWHCDVEIKKSETLAYTTTSFTADTPPTCSATSADCPLCKRCTIILSVATLIGFSGILLLFLTETKKRKRHAAAKKQQGD